MATRPQGIILFFFLIVVICLSVMATLKCCNDCPQNYEASNLRALKLHQKHCEAAQRRHLRSIQTRKLGLAKNQIQRSSLYAHKARNNDGPVSSSFFGSWTCANPKLTQVNPLAGPSHSHHMDVDVDGDLADTAAEVIIYLLLALGQVLTKLTQDDPRAGPSQSHYMDIDGVVTTSGPPIASMAGTLEPDPETSTQSETRPIWQRRLPARYRDILPQPAPSVVNDVEAQRTHIPRILLIVRDTIRTVTNAFGLWREYQHRPSYDPDSAVDADELANAGESDVSSPSVTDHDPNLEPIHQNSTIEHLINWQNTGSASKSNNEVNRLVKDVLLHPDFSADDLKGFDATRKNQRLDKADAKSSHLTAFQETSVTIEVPSGDKTKPAQPIQIPGLYFRKLTTVIKDAFQSPLASQYHFSPFKLYRTSPTTGEHERIYSEIYNSDSFIKEHDRVQRAPVPDDDWNCKREKIVAALMFWSDSTHLANFGTAKLWPIYMFLGNLSKYTRSHPTAHACHHLAYIPSLPDWFQDLIASSHPKWATQKKEILTHCRRELFHAVWKVLLDDAFLHVYKYGIVIKCHDGVERRVYPRIFTYAADYPEKYVFLANIRQAKLKQSHP